jgi:Protein of unknown function (DUF1571)
MKKLALQLPVLLVGGPILLSLLVASAPSQEEAPAGRRELPVKPVLRDNPPKLAEPAEGASALERLAREDPVAFLEQSLEHYQREVRGYHCILQKQERIAGKLQPKETIDVYFREDPHSVLMRWQHGARKAEGALFVIGENNGKMLARPSGSLARRIVGDVVERDVDGAEARQSGRYTLSQFGIKKGTERTLAAWKASRQRGKLQVEYLGEQVVKEAGDRPCYKLRRTYEAPEADGVTELTIYVDKDTLLQVGSVLKGENGQLIGEYFWRDIQLNPSFGPGQFERDALTPP